MSSGGSVNFLVNGANRISSSALSANTWYHLALSRVSGNTKMFLNGTQTGSTYADTNSYLVGAKGFNFGASTYDSSPYWFMNGYMDDVRITKGIGRYSSNFTAPSAAFPDF